MNKKKKKKIAILTKILLAGVLGQFYPNVMLHNLCMIILSQKI